MLTVNETTGSKDYYYDLVRGIVYSNDDYIEFGYFDRDDSLPKTYYDGQWYYDLRKDLNVIKVFSVSEGRELKFTSYHPSIEHHKNIFGCGAFPYSIKREYGAEKHLKEFKNTVKISNEHTLSYAKELKYSFGIEFETAVGYLPEQDCFDLGLIPLRDGSIGAVEYSTIPMEGNEGLNLVKRQLEVLKKYTYTNKECSTHIHLGGYPVTPKAIFILHTLWWYMQHKLTPYIPAYSYSTCYFKKNEKNYCSCVNRFDTFKDLYQYYVGQSYMGDLYQPHPKDLEKEAKWNIKTRYFNCNFINMLCYNSAKTVEFRFLTPTYSYEKLTTFLFIFNGILKYAEKLYKEYKNKSDSAIRNSIEDLCIEDKLSLVTVLNEVYSKDVMDWLTPNLNKLNWLIQTQSNAGDMCGSRLDIENRYFPDGKQES